MPDNILNNQYLNQTIAIIAGRGLLPKLLIESFEKKGQKFLLFLLDSENYEIDYSAFNPIILPYGNISAILEIINHNKIKYLVLVGAVNKPNFSTIKADKKGGLLISQILAKKILGDDTVLQTVINFFEKEGLTILTLDQLLEDIASKVGILTELAPSQEDQQNIEIAIEAIKTMSCLDVGQAVIVAQKQIIGVEAIEGTDNLIARCAKLEVGFKKDAILVKLKKLGQTNKADLPVIGISTVKNCHEAGIKGIAIQAKATLIINKAEVIKLASELGIFIASVKLKKAANFSFFTRLKKLFC
jgi:DUF1009 family protein